MAATNYWYVDSTLGNDANSCAAPGLGNACKTIQAAINKASPNDTVNVAAGMYPEPAPGPLTVNKTLTLLGAHSGIDARGRVAPESIVTDSQGTYVAADNVVIDGFTIQDSTNNAFTGYGIWMGGHSGTQILNDIVQDNIIGVGLSTPRWGRQVLIRHNQIQHNNQPGSASGTGIYSDQYEGVGTAKNFLIEENAFIDNNDAGIDISNTDSTKGVSNLDVSHNSFDGNGRGLVLFDTDMSTIHDNSITNSTTPLSAAIRIFDNNSNLSIMHNELITGAGRGIRMSDIDAVDPGTPNPSSNVVIKYNNIEVFANEGLLVATGGHVGGQCRVQLVELALGADESEQPRWDRRGGCWGCRLHPLAHRTRAERGMHRRRTFHSREGDRRGPGPGRPDLLPLGDLLSVPAVIPSLNNPTAQSTFGFVATCCTPTGNLEYNDHAMDVRIKAQSISGLFITNGSCGTNTHAKITGTASVIRSTGTTTEPFTVDVDDCGEPGTTDTFGITTTTYSRPPSALLGGNIQIHKK